MTHCLEKDPNCDETMYKAFLCLSIFQTCQIEADGSYYGIGYHYQNHFITNYSDSGFEVNATGVGLKYIHQTGSKWK